MKKIFSVFFAVLLMFSFAGCNNGSAAKDTEIQRGKIKGNTYTSKPSGLKFTKPDHWRYLTDKELAQTLSISEEILSNKEFMSALDEYPTLLDMMIMDDETGLNMAIGYENLEVTMGSVISEDEYLNAMAEYLETMGAASSEDIETVYLSGQAYRHAIFTVEIDGLVTVTEYYLHAIDKYMNVITVAYTSDVAAPDIENMFS